MCPGEIEHNPAPVHKQNQVQTNTCALGRGHVFAHADLPVWRIVMRRYVTVASVIAMRSYRYVTVP
jgi:hypothetical protein